MADNYKIGEEVAELQANNQEAHMEKSTLETRNQEEGTEKVKKEAQWPSSGRSSFCWMKRRQNCVCRWREPKRRAGGLSVREEQDAGSGGRAAGRH